MTVAGYGSMTYYYVVDSVATSYAGAGIASSGANS